MQSSEYIKLLFFIGSMLFCHLIPTSLQAQDKRDYMWFLGNNQGIFPEFRALKFDFNKKPFEPEIREKGLRFDRNNVSVCDKNGELLFYSNGCAIANRDHEVMMNGDSINASEFFDDFWFNGSCGFGYPGRQDMLILQDPRKIDGYYTIHKRLDRSADLGFDVHSLSYSYVDLSLENGLGGVTQKNIDFYTIDKFQWSYLTAIYQENGKDWWVVNPGADSKFYFFSIDDDGINLAHILEANHTFGSRNTSAGGDAKFSPDGTKYAYFNQTDGLLLYDFDRREGRLSDVRKLSIPIFESASFATCEWSPNSEFLYLATGDSLWQVEVAYEDLEDGKVFIAEHNGVRDPFSTRFFVSTLGPDCRIYIRPGSSSYSFHVIHKPNEKGQACDLVQQGIKLPEVSSTGSFPNFPRFRVDEEEKCDPRIVSIAGEAVWWRRDLTVYPSPASEYVTVEIPEGKNGTVYILDIEGQIIHHTENLSGKESIDVSHLATGVYSVEFVPEQNKERVVYTKRIVVD